MRIEIVRAWMLVGFCLVLVGMYLYMLQITEGGKLAVFLAAMGACLLQHRGHIEPDT